MAEGARGSVGENSLGETMSSPGMGGLEDSSAQRTGTGLVESRNGQDSFGGAGQYSFFGDLDGGGGGLEDGLEEGVEAPPEEEFPDGQALDTFNADDDLDGNLSLAAMLAHKLELNKDDSNALGLSFDGAASASAPGVDGSWEMAPPDQGSHAMYAGSPFGGVLGLGFSNPLGLDVSSPMLPMQGSQSARGPRIGLQNSLGGFGSPQTGSQLSLQQQQLQAQQMASLMTPEQQQQQYQSLLTSSPGGLQGFQSTGGSQDYGGTLTDAAIVGMSRGQPPHIPRLNLPAALQQQQQQQQERVQADFNFSMQQLSQQLSSQQLQQLTNRQVANADLPMGMGSLGGGMGLGSLNPFQQETMNRLNQMSLPDVGLSQRSLGGPVPLGANLMGGLGGVPGQVVMSVEELEQRLNLQAQANLSRRQAQQGLLPGDFENNLANRSQMPGLLFPGATNLGGAGPFVNPQRLNQGLQGFPGANQVNPLGGAAMMQLQEQRLQALQLQQQARLPLVPTPRGAVNLAQRERELALQAAMFNMNNPAAQGLTNMDRRMMDLEQQSIRIQSHQLMLRQQALQRQQQVEQIHQRQQMFQQLQGPRAGYGRPNVPPMNRPTMSNQMGDCYAPHFPRMGVTKQGSKHMEREEIEQILRIQWKSLHSGSPYTEDYYFQAYMKKHSADRDTRAFAPEMLREQAPAERVGPEPAAYLKLEGALGRQMFSDLKRPRALMDLDATPPEEMDDTEEEVKETCHKLLEEEPLLAARLVIENSMCLLLDVDDIDRMCSPPFNMRDHDEHALRTRRALLLEGYSHSLRLPDQAILPPTPLPNNNTDGVFRMIMSLPKGRTMLARALPLLFSPMAKVDGMTGPAGPAPMKIVWAMLRNVNALFNIQKRTLRGPGPAVDESNMQHDIELEATSKVALAAIEVLQKVETPRALCDCMAAVVHGDLGAAPLDSNPRSALLPLYATSDRHEAANGRRPWLADVLKAMLKHAELHGLANFATGHRSGGEGLAGPEGQAWRECFEIFYNKIIHHMEALQQVYHAAVESNQQHIAETALRVVPQDLMKAMLPHANPDRVQQLQGIIAEFSQIARGGAE